MDNTTNLWNLSLPTVETMYQLPRRVYLHITSGVVEGFGEPRRRYREVFIRAYPVLKNGDNPNIKALGLDDIYTPGSAAVTTSRLHTLGVLDYYGFFTTEFHAAYYRECQRIYRLRTISVKK